MITTLCAVAAFATIIFLSPPFMWTVTWLIGRSIGFWFRRLPDIHPAEDARRGAR